jgi:transposase
MSKPKSPRSSSRKPTTAGRIIKAQVNTDFQLLNQHAAGIDIGADRHYVAVGPSASPHPVREFSVFTKDLYAIADWLANCGVKTVAMESTGVYWVPLYEVLDERGFKVKLVDARKVKNVSGRKSDVLDCQWLQQLESYALLQAAYRPADEMIVLRGYMRQRGMLVKSAASHIQHMQKALQQMNLRLDNVVSDITGQTGMRILKAILRGERDVKKLGAYYRRMQARKGPGAAITATAHKMARLYYSLVKQGQEYEEGRAEAYQERQRERAVTSLRKRAKGLGYELVEIAA